MHRARRLGEYWNWLPTFRAVAETESLRDAATRIHVAPSAISRTVRLLEGSLGYSLFTRTAGTLVLNADGRHLLEAVRAAMRLVDDASSERELGPCHIHCPADVTPLLVGAIETWSTAHPGEPALVHVPCAEDVSAQLVRGDLDVALAFEQSSDAGIACVLLGNFSSSVYCSPSHEASQLARLTDHELETLPFVDFPVGGLGFLRIMRDHDRQRAAYVPTMDLAVQLCARGTGLVCVPDFVARRAGSALHRLPWEGPTGKLHIWFRRPVTGAPRPAIVEHLVSWPAFSDLVHPSSAARPARRTPSHGRSEV